jgi:hypothetical protein
MPFPDLEIAAIERELRLLCTLASDESLRARLAVLADKLASLRLREASPHPGDQRRDMRAGTALVTRLRVEGAEQLCAVCDISRGGALIETDEPLVPGAEVALYLPNGAFVTATVLECSDRGIHLAFGPLAPADEVAVVDLVKSRYAA